MAVWTGSTGAGNITTGRAGRAFRGRAAVDNPANRFERYSYQPDRPLTETLEVPPPSEYIPDHSKSIISRNDSPDIHFDASVNPYRGCEHGCIYCYARPTHEFLGMSAGLEFETKILVKERAPELLREELESTRWKPQVLAMSGVTDPYQPVERRLGITRRCIEVLAEFRNPVCIITKSHLVTRDVDVLGRMGRRDLAAVMISLTTLDPGLARQLEPRAASPLSRLAAITELSRAGIPVGVLVSPVIPGLTDHEIPALLEQAARAGASHAGFAMVRLPLSVGPLFEDWLERFHPERKDKVLNRIREIRGGSLNDSRFGHRFRGEGIFAHQIRDLFGVSCRRSGLQTETVALDTTAFRRRTGQLTLFDEE